jgi:alcohol dehydrogenase
VSGSNWFTTAEAQEMADMAGCGALDLSSWQTEAFPITRINEGLEFVAARQGGFVNAIVTITP